MKALQRFPTCACEGKGSGLLALFCTVYWGYIGITGGSILGLYWDNGKENGNYYSILRLYWGHIGTNGKENGNYLLFRSSCVGAEVLVAPRCSKLQVLRVERRMLGKD